MSSIYLINHLLYTEQEKYFYFKLLLLNLKEVILVGFKLLALNHQQLLLRKYHFHYINMLSIKKLEWTVKHYHFHVELLFDSLSDWFAFSIDCLLQLKEEEFYWNNPFFSPSAECTQEKWGFPMCHYLKEERWLCGRNARMSACLVWLYFFFLD